MFIEMLLFAIHTPFFIDLAYNATNRISSNPFHKEQTRSFQAMNQAVTFLSISKCYFIVKLLPLFTSVTAATMNKVREIKGVRLNFQFYVKVLMLEKPLQFLSCILLCIIVLFGLSIFIYERGQLLLNPKTGLLH